MAAYTTQLPPKNLLIQTVAFLFGSTVLHSAACVINDICDIDFDRQVERTKHRPLAAGNIPVSGAWKLLFVLTCSCIGMLLLTNPTAAFCGIFGVFPLHALYPLMKRWTWWPQAWLGLAMNWGLPVTWISVTGSCNWEAIPLLFVGTWCWTMVYDSIYACQDKEDDKVAGVKSTALLFGDWIRPILIGFSVVFLGCLAGAGILNGQGPAFYIISVGGAIIYMLWQFNAWKVDNPDNCGEMFKANGHLGNIVWIGLLIDYYCKISST